jgi:hypothetical protein
LRSEFQRRPLRKGDLVEVRSAREILATLDEHGRWEAVPFMPEMVAFCGRRFTVAARADRVCDTIHWSGARSMTDTVLLDDLRCDGSGHSGCAAECRIYWKEAWLTRVKPTDPPCLTAPDHDAEELLMQRVRPNSVTVDCSGGEKYRCQATEAFEASVALSPKDPRSYLCQWTMGNVSLPHFARVMCHAVVVESARNLGWSSEPSVRGSGPSSPRLATLGLQPGEWVRVKSRREIEATLNEGGKNRGLWFDREMLRFCGEVFQVRQRVTRLVDDQTGRLIELTSDCVTLEGAVCSGENSPGRWFCPRAIFPYWREGWLERTDPPASG